jgi:hypothetical protein
MRGEDMTVYIEQLLLDEAWRRTRRRRRFLGSLAVLLAAGAIIVAAGGFGGGPGGLSTSSTSAHRGDTTAAMVSVPPLDVEYRQRRAEYSWCVDAPPRLIDWIKGFAQSWPALMGAATWSGEDKLRIMAVRLRWANGTISTAFWFPGVGRPTPANAVAAALTGGKVVHYRRWRADLRFAAHCVAPFS